MTPSFTPCQPSLSSSTRPIESSPAAARPSRHPRSRPILLALFLLAVAQFALVATVTAGAVRPVNRTLFGGLALDGYDPVAYFAQGKAIKGSKELQLEWNGATWLFSSVAHRDSFRTEPERWAPQYGGYCAWAVSQGYTADIDPEAWAIVDGKLYLNYNHKIRQQWQTDRDANIEAADRNWPKLIAGSGG